MARILLIFALLVWPLKAVAQDDDRGYLTGLLESSLGGEGRIVRIDGFAGALSSRATVDRITVADDQGVWLEMTDLVLGWNRGALLRGRVEIEELSAASITLTRLPAAQEDELPPAEAQGFSLPDLPVSITVGSLASPRITIGAPVLGQELVMTLDASASLADGAADVALRSKRIDAKQGRFDIATRFDGTSLDIKVDISEGAGGIAASLIGIPEEPPVELTVDGTGPLSDFNATLRLATSGQERLAGTIGLRDRDGGRGFEADLGGDVTALFAPQYREFFGPDVALQASGVSGADGALTLDQLNLATEALRLRGTVALDDQGWPRALDITGDMGNSEATPVLLPLSGPPTRLQDATLSVQFDAAQSDRFEASFDITNLATPEIAIGAVTLEASGTLESAASVQADLQLAANALVFGDPSLQAAVGDTVSGALNLNYENGETLNLSNLDISGADYALTGAADIAGLNDALSTTFDLGLQAQSLARFALISGQDLSGAAELTLRGTADLGGTFDVEIEGLADDLALGIAQADAVLDGRTELAIAAARDEAGTRVEALSLENDQLTATGSADVATDNSRVVLDARLNDAALLAEQLTGPLTLNGTATQDTRGWSVDMDAAGPFDATAAVDGLATGPQAALNFALALPDINPLVPEYSGAVDLDGVLRQSPKGWRVDTKLAAPFDLSADVEGRVTGENAPDVTFSARLPDINPLVPQYSGAVTVEGRAQMLAEGLQIDTDLTGPFALEASVAGRVTGENTPDIAFEARLPDINPLVPQYRGALAVTGTAQQQGEALGIDTKIAGPYGLQATVSGEATGPSPRFDYTLSLPNLAPLVANLNGPLRAQGTAAQNGFDWQVTSDIDGPAGTNARVAGRVGGDGQVNLTANGAAPMALANPFIAPRSVQGQVRFDLAVNGAPGLDAVSGQITTNDARLASPDLPVTINDIDAQIGLGAGRANLTLRAGVAEGGAVTVNGPVTLSGNFPAELEIALQNLGIEDPSLYRTRLNSALSVNGGLTGGARIAGQIDVGETQVTVPSSGLGGFAIIPEIVHIGASQAVRVTQDRAGMNTPAASESGGGPAYPLDISINAPGRVFVRGRGLDAELGGSLRLTGDTNNIISAGRFELVRGRLDILEKRFDLDEGSVQLQGSFDPFLRFVATTRTSSGTASVIIEGPASAPEVSFTASPEAPQDEVLAQIFFGRSAADLSAFQALQLANAVATLAGRGGESVISRLRRSFDLDDLDVNTDNEGNTAVRAGKYISDNVYTDVEVGGADGPEVSINIDLTPSLTARGTTSAQGNSSIGIFFERDY
ncbi:MAG: translocation/assembly module TamB domain-containing protein [Litoreibacter sp.]|nr:translocation/assembly module TamB domain-containing protein [Litoreibacter sp.]